MREAQAAGGAAAAFENVGSLAERLAEHLGGVVGGRVHVDGLTKYPAGFSWRTYGVRLRGFPPSREAILRVGPPYGLFAPYSAMPEFESLSALAQSRVPAPRVYLASDDLTIIGAPFFLSQKVEGDTPLPWGTQSQKLEGARRQQLAEDFIDALAALHGFDWRATALRRWGDGVTLENAATRQIDEWEGRFRRWALKPHPMAHRALAWLRARAPRAERLSLVHGDYRLGNFLERDGRITAILDWELVHLGDPIEDLGWAFLPQYRGGGQLVCGLASEEEFLARYTAQSGVTVAPATLRFYVVFALLKLAFTHMAAARCFEDGLFNDMRMPAMATQIAPVFRQMAKRLGAAT
ncbi:MAG: phosphotransferase family protein [Pseudomonadota bacterium]|nr:phosphotransferase family protein [Pseudomonadota bacterium]